MYEVNFSGYFITNGSDVEDATNSFKEIMSEDYPEIDVDRINNIEEVK